MKTRFGAWSGVLLFASVACGTAPVASHSEATASIAGSPAPSQCRLPVSGFMMPAAKGTPDTSSLQNGQPNQAGTGGFVNFPGGTYTPAAASNSTYVAAVGKWFPVPTQAVAPDGSSYVDVRVTGDANRMFVNSSLYLVDTRTGAERRLMAAPVHEWLMVLGYTDAGVYAETVTIKGDFTFTLLLIDPASGTSHQLAHTTSSITTRQPWSSFSGDAAWGMTMKQSPEGQPEYTLVRLDVTTGKQADWYTTKDSFTVAGFDGAHEPILLLFGAPARVVVVAGPGHSVLVTSSGAQITPGRGLGVTDQHGTWFGSADGSIWLYAGGKLAKVATVPPQAGATGEPCDPHAWRSIAGPCV